MSEQRDYFFAVLDADIRRAKDGKMTMYEVIRDVFESYAEVFFEYVEGKEEESKPKVRPEYQDQYEILRGYVEYIQIKIDRYTEELKYIRSSVVNDFKKMLDIRFSGNKEKIYKSLRKTDITNLIFFKKKSIMKSQLELIELQAQMKQKMKYLEEKE